MTQLVGRHIKIETVDHMRVMGCRFAQSRGDSMLYTLSVFILVIGPFFGRSGSDILPEPLELGIRQWITVTIGNDIV